MFVFFWFHRFCGISGNLFSQRVFSNSIVISCTFTIASFDAKTDFVLVLLHECFLPHMIGRKFKKYVFITGIMIFRYSTFNYGTSMLQKNLYLQIWYNYNFRYEHLTGTTSRLSLVSGEIIYHNFPLKTSIRLKNAISWFFTLTKENLNLKKHNKANLLNPSCQLWFANVNWDDLLDF